MVHALEEVERVLEPGGTLVDLRPVAARWPLDIYVAGEARLAGRIDDSAKALDDIAADRALEVVVSRKLFSQITANSFEYPYYWNTLEQMTDYFQESWSSSATLPSDVLDEAERLAGSEAFDSKICVRRKMIIGTYRARKGRICSRQD
ncbi:MAG: hypothetical protein ACE5M4_13490 [Anaerolineales bacterium]